MPDFEAGEADRHFAGEFFNETWNWLDKPRLSEDEADRMIHCCHASWHHWSRVSGHTPENTAIGYWQLARVYEKAGLAEGCQRYAELCMRLARTEGKPGLLLGAHEVLARAAAMRGDAASLVEHRALAEAELQRVVDPEDRKIYAADIAGIPGA